MFIRGKRKKFNLFIMLIYFSACLTTTFLFLTSDTLALGTSPFPGGTVGTDGMIEWDDGDPIDPDPLHVGEHRIKINTSNGSPGTEVIVSWAGGDPFSENSKVKFEFDDPEHHLISLPITTTFVVSGKLRFFVPEMQAEVSIISVSSRSILAVIVAVAKKPPSWLLVLVTRSLKLLN